MVLVTASIEYFILYHLVLGIPFPVDKTPICNLKSPYCYWTSRLILIYGITVLTITIAGFDVFFIGIIVCCYCEFKLIKRGLMTLNEIDNQEECFEEFSKLVEHHSQVLKYVNVFCGSNLS